MTRRPAPSKPTAPRQPLIVVLLALAFVVLGGPYEEAGPANFALSTGVWRDGIRSAQT